MEEMNREAFNLPQKELKEYGFCAFCSEVGYVEENPRDSNMPKICNNCALEVCEDWLEELKEMCDRENGSR